MNPNTQEAKAYGFLSLRAAWSENNLYFINEGNLFHFHISFEHIAIIIRHIMKMQYTHYQEINKLFYKVIKLI